MKKQDVFEKHYALDGNKVRRNYFYRKGHSQGQ